MTTEIVRFMLNYVGNTPSKSNTRVWHVAQDIS